MKKQYFKYIAFLLLIVSFAACKKNAEVILEKKAPINVTVVAVQQNEIKEYLTFNGLTQYQKKENIRSNVTGYISWIKYKIGDNIHSGQTFASVRTKEQDALKEAVKIDPSLSKFVSPITIRSNVTGIFTALNITANDYVAEGDVLATVVQPKSLVIQVNVPYEYEKAIQIGSSCEIILQNGEVLNAKVTGTLPTIDLAAQSQVFLIALPNANLPENLNVEVRTVYKEDATAMTIPKTALQTNELLTEYWVLKVVNDSMALKQKVEPLLKNDSLVQIKSEDIHVNDLVITKGGYQMQDSTIVSFKR
ncbi:HlyD family secretion protein [Flaviramulus basaltis]|uniref:HlyD family secretion protein n=1 Tax=Flaviramulus basaltis TaxID=369401 RepID=A0A1K2IPN8_9FLAO|nr:HlyD family efflux transporter periplasmic adaptor subunit [Flaviramulus basaltis]SFZ94226.1 HlyD family secretion protein [Flaviramulus basaltis]